MHSLPCAFYNVLLCCRSSTGTWLRGTSWWITIRTARSPTLGSPATSGTWGVRCTSKRTRGPYPSGTVYPTIVSRNLRDLGDEMYEQKNKGALPIRFCMNRTDSLILEPRNMEPEMQVTSELWDMELGTLEHKSFGQGAWNLGTLEHGPLGP